ncbi:MAG: molybdenum cofactor sulfurase [Ignavibacteria bacterium GWF2_33_9]|nr:MAG: molybdenum cofactor sulfurase [Ignavibacteria bacterium GWF2_33_9]
MGVITAISISRKKGIPKSNIESANLIEDFGIEGDAHATFGWHRQISLLAMESIEKMLEKLPKLTPGIFAENITTTGLDLTAIKIGTKIKIGKSALLEITQIGKECHSKCAIYRIAGDCVMPTEGIFAKVIAGGYISVNDEIEILEL